MSCREALTAFFQAENRRDWEVYRTFLHEDVVWILHGGEDTEIRGTAAYLERIRAAYTGNNSTFIVRELWESGTGNRIAALLVNDRGERSWEIFDFKDGKIWREHEFLL